MNPWQSEDDGEQLVNIPLMAMKRANRSAMDHLGQKWSTSHDRYSIRWLFKNGHITDFEKELLLDKVADKVHRIRKMDPGHGGWRVW